MRLIDADGLEQSCIAFETHGGVRFISLGLVRTAPTIDAVPVVRCKDCVQWDRHCGVVDSPNGHCWTHDIEMNGYDFCSYGERKENDHAED